MMDEATATPAIKARVAKNLRRLRETAALDPTALEGAPISMRVGSPSLSGEVIFPTTTRSGSSQAPSGSTPASSSTESDGHRPWTAETAETAMRSTIEVRRRAARS